MFSLSSVSCGIRFVINELNSGNNELLNISKINPLDVSVIGNSLTSALNGVHSVDISQVKAVTDMFNAFKGINKSENIINKFAESVKEFTEACKDLTEAMNNNIDTINSDSSFDEDGSIFDKLKNKVKKNSDKLQKF